MTDMEKVIKGITHCKAQYGCYNRQSIDGEDCPYVDEPDCRFSIMQDALALLKEQEAVVPILICEGRNKNYNDYVCPRCDNEVVYEQNYCSECGVKFMWESR